MPCASVSANRTRTSVENAKPPTSASLELAEGQLDVAGEAAHADADQAERAGPVSQGAIEERARQLADAGRVGGSDRHRGRARADREVRVAELRRHGPRDLTSRPEVLGQVLRHAAQLVVEP